MLFQRWFRENYASRSPERILYLNSATLDFLPLKNSLFYCQQDSLFFPSPLRVRSLPFHWLLVLFPLEDVRWFFCSASTWIVARILSERENSQKSFLRHQMSFLYVQHQNPHYKLLFPVASACIAFHNYASFSSRCFFSSFFYISFSYFFFFFFFFLFSLFLFLFLVHLLLFLVLLFPPATSYRLISESSIQWTWPTAHPLTPMNHS